MGENSKDCASSKEAEKKNQKKQLKSISKECGFSWFRWGPLFPR
ncbi:hypothetical protein [Eubacterium aggregans]